jgi:hypothetical protein
MRYYGGTLVGIVGCHERFDAHELDLDVPKTLAHVQALWASRHTEPETAT